MSVVLTSRHKNDLAIKKKYINDNLCAKDNGVTRQNLGWETHQNCEEYICTHFNDKISETQNNRTSSYDATSNATYFNYFPITQKAKAIHPSAQWWWQSSRATGCASGAASAATPSWPWPRPATRAAGSLCARARPTPSARRSPRLWPRGPPGPRRTEGRPGSGTSSASMPSATRTCSRSPRSASSWASCWPALAMPLVTALAFGWPLNSRYF